MHPARDPAEARQLAHVPCSTKSAIGLGKTLLSESLKRRRGGMGCSQQPKKKRPSALQGGVIVSNDAQTQLSGWRQVPLLELEMCSTWQCSNGKDGSMECPLGPDAARPTNKGEGIFINATRLHVLKGGFAPSVKVGKPALTLPLWGLARIRATLAGASPSACSAASRVMLAASERPVVSHLSAVLFGVSR